jgi:hypothetical protein
MAYKYERKLKKEYIIKIKRKMVNSALMHRNCKLKIHSRICESVVLMVNELFYEFFIDVDGIYLRDCYFGLRVSLVIHYI